MKRLLTSCFGLGWLPPCPGTFGSLPPVFIFALMFQLGLSVLAISIVMAAMVLAGSVICVIFSPAVIAATGRIDPPEVVADEFAGQALTLLFVLLLIANTHSTKQLWIIAGLGFLLFRLFDVVKPWPINAIQKLPQGWGILADDLMAAIYAAVALFIFQRIWVLYHVSSDS